MYRKAQEQTDDDQNVFQGIGKWLREDIQFPVSRNHPRGTGNIILWTEGSASLGDIKPVQGTERNMHRGPGRRAGEDSWLELTLEG